MHTKHSNRAVNEIITHQQWLGKFQDNISNGEVILVRNTKRPTNFVVPQWYNISCVKFYAKQKHLGCKKVRGQSEATLLTGICDQKL